MTDTPIERAVDVWMDDIDKRGLVLDSEIAFEDVRVIFSSIDEGELGQAARSAWLATTRTRDAHQGFWTEVGAAIKEHLLQEPA